MQTLPHPFASILQNTDCCHGLDLLAEPPSQPASQPSSPPPSPPMGVRTHGKGNGPIPSAPDSPAGDSNDSFKAGGTAHDGTGYPTPPPVGEQRRVRHSARALTYCDVMQLPLPALTAALEHDAAERQKELRLSHAGTLCERLVLD